MPDRFYAPRPWLDLIELNESESHHLAKVLRAKAGDLIEVFDGQGTCAHARIETIHKRTVSVRVTCELQTTPPPECQIVLVVAVPKGDRLSWMIEKVTELGVDRLIPVSTERSIVKPSDQKLHKAEATAIAACKQSHRDRLPSIDPLGPLTDLPQRIPFAESHLVYGAPSSGHSVSLDSKSNYNCTHLVGIIGPEGGLTDDEISLLERWNAHPVCLGPHILRIETAAIAFVANAVTGRSRVQQSDS